MKKLIIFFIIAAQLIPLGVSAAQTSHEINRWVYEDFEKSDISHITAVNATLKRSSMYTYGASNGSLEVSVTKNSGAPSFKTEQKAGVTYDISCYIKMKETPLKNQVQFIFQAPTENDDTKKAYNTVTVSDASLKAGQWVHVTARYVCDGKGKLVGNADRVNVKENGTVDIRIGNGNIADTSANGKSIDYYLDDFTVIPVVSSEDGNLVTDGDFEAPSPLSSWTKSSSSAVSVVEDEYGKCAYVSGRSNMSNISQTVPVKFNTDYTISFKLKTDDADTINKQVQMIFDRHASKTDDSIKNYEYLRDEANMTIGSEWTEYKINYRYDIETDDEAYPAVYIRIGGGDASDIKYYIDDVVITETDAPEAPGPMDIDVQGTPKEGGVFTADISYDSGDIAGYIVSVSRKSDGAEAMVYSAVTAEPVFEYTASNADCGYYLVFKAYAVTADGKIAASASEMTQAVRGNGSISSEINNNIWTDADSEVSGTVRVENSDKTLRLMSVIALYDSRGVLVKTGMRISDINEGDNADINVSAENVQGAEHMKLFALDADTLEPYTAVKTIDKISGAQLIFVDGENGSDSADGSANAPLRTIKAAKDAAAKLISESDVYVMLKGGTYRLEEPISFTPSSLGKTHKTVFASYGGRAEISGGRTVSGWSVYDAEKNIYRAYAGKDIDFRQMYVNGARGIRARSSAGLTNVSMTDTGYISDDAFLLDIAKPDNLEMVYHIKWSNPRCAVSSVSAADGKTVITMNPTGWSKVRNKGQSSVTKDFMPSYYENAYELIDEEGEWYFDKDGGYLYYKPRFFEDMQTADVQVPALEKLLTIRGTADNNAQNLEFADIDFKYATWLKPTQNGYLADTQNNHQSGVTGGLPDAAVELSYVDGIAFKGCEFSKLGITALKLTEGVKNCIIEENEFYDISGSAVSLGVPSGDYNKYINPSDERYVVRNNVVNGNYIHHTGVDYMSAAAISAAFPKDTEISNNEIFDSPYSGMHLGYGWATYADNGTATENLTVSGNYIHNVLNDKIYDGGAIYTIGNTSGKGYNKISRNYIKDVKNHYGALYPDEGSQYWEFSSNVMDLSAYPLLYGAGAGSGTPTKWLHLWTDSIKNNRIVNNYSTTANSRNDGRENEVQPPVICDASAWTPEAEDIIKESGISARTAQKFKRGLQDIDALTEYSAKAGEEIELSIAAFTGKGEKYDYRYSDIYMESSDTDVAVIEDGFKVRAVSGGTAYIKAAIAEKGIIKSFLMKICVE